VARLARRDAANLPAQASRLHAALEQASTPDELMSVAALADAIAAKARTLKKASKADGLIDEARAAFGAQVDAVFARVGVIRKAAAVLPDGQGTRTDLSLDVTSDDFGISRMTSARWKAWADRLASVDLAGVRAGWDATVAGPPEDWRLAEIGHASRRLVLALVHRWCGCGTVSDNLDDFACRRTPACYPDAVSASMNGPGLSARELARLRAALARTRRTLEDWLHRSDGDAAGAYRDVVALLDREGL
jgi:hypothetical protein